MIDPSEHCRGIDFFYLRMIYCNQKSRNADNPEVEI